MRVRLRIAIPIIIGLVTVVGVLFSFVSRTTIYDWRLANQTERSTVWRDELLDVLFIGNQPVRVGYGKASLGFEVGLIKTRPEDSRIIARQVRLAAALFPRDIEAKAGCRAISVNDRMNYEGRINDYSIYEARLGKCSYLVYKDSRGKIGFSIVTGPFRYREKDTLPTRR